MSAEPRKLFEKDWSKVRGSMQGLHGEGKSFGIMRTAKIKTLGNMGASLQGVECRRGQDRIIRRFSGSVS